MTSNLLFNVCTLGYLLSLVLLLAYVACDGRWPALLATWAARAAFGLHGAGMVWRWYESHQLPGGVGRVPLTNLYESVVFFAWAIMLFYLVLDLKLLRPVVGIFVLPFALAGMAWAQVFLSDAIEPLMPALRSRWLVYHVVSCFLAYAAFTLACAASIMGLLQAVRQSSGEPGRSRILAVLLRRAPDAAQLDQLNYRAIAIGFPIWTLGIVTGSVWANSAWGSYWSWDPKETWSLIVWLIYAAFLHARLTRGWEGRRAAWLSIVGFAATLFCYLGVNLLLSGLHSYAS